MLFAICLLLLLLQLGHAASKHAQGTKLCTLRSSVGDDCVGTNTIGNSVQKMIQYFCNIFKVDAKEPTDSNERTYSEDENDPDRDDYIYLPHGHGASIQKDNDEDNYITILFGKRSAENGVSIVKRDSKNSIEVTSKNSVTKTKSKVETNGRVKVEADRFAKAASAKRAAESAKLKAEKAKRDAEKAVLQRKAENDRLVKAEADRLAKVAEAEVKAAKLKAENDRLVKAEADRLAKALQTEKAIKSKTESSVKKAAVVASSNDEDTYIDLTGRFGKSSVKVTSAKVGVKASSVADRKSPIDSVYSFLAFLSPKPTTPASTTKVAVKSKPISSPKVETKSVKSLEAVEKSKRADGAKLKAENDRLVKAEADRLAKALQTEKAAKSKTESSVKKAAVVASSNDEDTYIDLTGRFGKSSVKVTSAKSDSDKIAQAEKAKRAAESAKRAAESAKLEAERLTRDAEKAVLQRKAENDRLVKAEADRLAEAAEAEKAAKLKADSYRLVKAEADRLDKAAEAEKAAKLKAENDRLVQAEAEKAAKLKAENDRLVKAEADRLAKALQTEKAVKSKTESSVKKAAVVASSNDEDTYIDLTDRFGNYFAVPKPVTTNKVSTNSKGLTPSFTLPKFNSNSKKSLVPADDRKGPLEMVLNWLNRKVDNNAGSNVASSVSRAKDRLLNDLINIGFGGLAVYILMSKKVAKVLAPPEQKSPEIIVQKEKEFVYVFSEVGKDFFMNSIIYALFVYFTLVMVFSLSPTFWLTYVPTAAEIQNKVASYAYI